MNECRRGAPEDLSTVVGFVMEMFRDVAPTFLKPRLKVISLQDKCALGQGDLRHWAMSPRSHSLSRSLMFVGQPNGSLARPTL